MKNYVKNSFKKLLAASLIMLSFCGVKADFWGNTPKEDPKRNLNIIYDEIAALGTPDDVSGLYNLLMVTFINVWNYGMKCTKSDYFNFCVTKRFFLKV